MKSKKTKYPYKDEEGRLHTSRHVSVYFDIEDVRRDLEKEEWDTDYDDRYRQVRSCFLGSWLSISPSGKIYAPFACSNVDECPVCHGAGEVRNPVKHRLRIKYKNQSEILRKRLLRDYGYHCDGKWPTKLRDRVNQLWAKSRDGLLCPRCDGLGSAEARDDELFCEALDLFVEGEADLYIQQEDGNVYVVQQRDVEDDQQ